MSPQGTRDMGAELQNEAHNLPKIAVRVPEMVWQQRLALALKGTQAGASALGS